MLEEKKRLLKGIWGEKQVFCHICFKNVHFWNVYTWIYMKNVYSEVWWVLFDVKHNEWPFLSSFFSCTPLAGSASASLYSLIWTCQTFPITGPFSHCSFCLEYSPRVFYGDILIMLASPSTVVSLPYFIFSIAPISTWHIIFSFIVSFFLYKLFEGRDFIMFISVYLAPRTVPCT